MYYSVVWIIWVDICQLKCVHSILVHADFLVFKVVSLDSCNLLKVLEKSFC